MTELAAVSLRGRIVAAAIGLTTRDGWSAVTMARLAEEVGVSRQTVYNELGSKPALAEAMVLDQLERFLAVVTTAFDEHPDDLVEAIRDAVRGVLELARDHTLLRGIVSASSGDSELLPLLTTDAGSVLVAAKAMVAMRVAAYRTSLSASKLDSAVDAVVRVVLSHAVQPTGEPAETADAIAWIADRILHD